MKLSDYVIDRLAHHGVTTIFGISGGAAVHLFDSIGKHSDVTYCCPSHEQTAALAADGYARATGRLGVCLTTSGPGATNLLTGVASSYYDSIPTLSITGQVALHRLRGDLPVRQIGFQETDIIDIFRPVTKYAVQIREPQHIRYELEKALYLAFADRPGPVLIDLPDDLQRAEVKHETMKPFFPPSQTPTEITTEIITLLKLLTSAQRPLVVLGSGLQFPRLDTELRYFIERFQLPMLTTWPAVDLLSHDHPLNFGTFGVYGARSGNLCIQNADLLLVLGSRLSQNLTGGILPSFARSAQIIMVDVDAGELEKFEHRGIHITLKIKAKLQDFFAQLYDQVSLGFTISVPAWLKHLEHWKKTFSIQQEPLPSSPEGKVGAYGFLRHLSSALPKDAYIYVDTGGTLTWTLNGILSKESQRIFSAWNYTPMGYALPAALGAAFALPGKPIFCIIGDGGLMLCLNELAVAVKHHLPIKILLFNNHGHGIQKQTLQTWLEGQYHGVDSGSGLSFVDFPRIATAMDIPVWTITDLAHAREYLDAAFLVDGPAFCNVEIDPDQKLYPVLKFGQSLEQQQPSLPVETIEQEMLIPPYLPHKRSL